MVKKTIIIGTLVLGIGTTGWCGLKEISYKLSKQSNNLIPSEKIYKDNIIGTTPMKVDTTLTKNLNVKSDKKEEFKRFSMLKKSNTMLTYDESTNMFTLFDTSRGMRVIGRAEGKITYDTDKMLKLVYTPKGNFYRESQLQYQVVDKRTVNIVDNEPEDVSKRTVSTLNVFYELDTERLTVRYFKEISGEEVVFHAVDIKQVPGSDKKAYYDGDIFLESVEGGETGEF